MEDTTVTIEAQDADTSGQEEYTPPSVETTENLPPQCSF